MSAHKRDDGNVYAVQWNCYY